jgi:hypothetical protein
MARGDGWPRIDAALSSQPAFRAAGYSELHPTQPA